VEMKIITIVRFADGKIVEHWGRPDLIGFMRQLSGEA
jgi:predicted ester cyclase